MTAGVLFLVALACFVVGAWDGSGIALYIGLVAAVSGVLQIRI